MDGSDTNEDGVFEWTTSNSELSYTRWRSGQPSSSLEDCTEINFGEAGMWNDLKCSSVLRKSVCEIKSERYVY